jgi:hypothetical protein
MTRSIFKSLAFALILLMPSMQSAQACDILCFPHLEWPSESEIVRPGSSGGGNQTSSEEEG